jgi:hypothetical protein
LCVDLAVWTWPPRSSTSRLAAGSRAGGRKELEGRRPEGARGRGARRSSRAGGWQGARSVVEGASSRGGGGRKALEGGRLARRDRRRKTFGSSTGRPAGRLLPCLRCEREAGGSSRGRPAGGKRREGQRRAAGEGRRELKLKHGRPHSRWRRMRF